MKNLLYKTLFTLLVGLVPILTVFGSHIRAGEITVQNLGGLNRRITLNIYYDKASQNVINNDLEADFEIYNPQGALYTTILKVPRAYIFAINSDTDSAAFITTIAFPSSGNWTISYKREFRNGCIINMSSPASTFFSVQTLHFIPNIFANSTPVFTVAPVDEACTGRKFVHIPGAFDPDGDSLSFELIVPKQGFAQNVNGYFFPFAGGPSIFNIDPISGVVTWDFPFATGCYNIAFIVKEFRDGDVIGTIIRDMQIVVKACTNLPPQLIVPQDTCVVAGSLLRDTIFAVDPNNDLIELSAFGGPFLQNPNPANFFVSNPIFSGGYGIFQWQTSCNHIRQQPYQAVFKAVDTSTTNLSHQALTDLKAWNITVIGPPPNLLAAVPFNGTMQLSWTPYICPQASSWSIWRKEGPPGYVPEYCDQGVRQGEGYVQIAALDSINVFSFVDTNNGAGLKKGVNYCYMIVAEFPPNKYGKSMPSNEVCGSLLLDGPVVTNVSVLETDPSNGKVNVRWTSPLLLDTVLFPGPHLYKLIRTGSFSPSSNITVFESFNLLDTSYTDTILNTLNEAYQYKVEFYYGPTTTFKESSPSAQNVRLSALANQVGRIQLNWQANVPWINRPFYHYIYREINDVPVLIDSVLVTNSNGQIYIDNGTFNSEPLISGITYCYFIRTQGSYFNPNLRSPLLNNSQRICQIAKDTIPPCAINISPIGLNCNSIDYTSVLQNKIFWSADIEAGCDTTIAGYEIYYTPNSETPSSFLAFTTDTFYVYSNQENLAGCFTVRVLDIFNNKSSFSNPLCFENCPYYVLPNLFTPNGDGKNEVFRPFPEPRFVKSVDFRVFSRWGNEVFRMNNDIYLNWSGNSSSGEPLSDGIYFYTAEVVFFSFTPEGDKKYLKGWVQIIGNRSNKE